MTTSAEVSDETHRCFICQQPFVAGQMVLSDVTEGLGHRECFGEDREAYVKDIDTGEPLGPDDPIPAGEPYDPADYAPTPRRAFVVTPEMVERFAPVGGDWFALSGDARLGSCATEGCGGQPTHRLEAGGIGSNYCSGCADEIQSPTVALSVVSHETGDDERGGELRQIISDAYENTMARPAGRRGPFNIPDASTDETQGVKREPVAWRVRERPGFDWRFVDGDPDRDFSLNGHEKQPLFSLSQLEAVERERDTHKRQFSEANVRAKNLLHRLETAEASLAAMRQALGRIAAIKYGKPATLYAQKTMIDYARDQARAALAGENGR